jgi:shikimate dehydrogenase
MLVTGVKGFNVTIPHKEHLYRMVDDLSQEARLAGAVNTVKAENSKLVGHNTDIAGFRAAFEEAFASSSPSSKKNALIIGAGGSARAVVVALAQLGFKTIKIKARNPEKIRSFINQMETNLSNQVFTKYGGTALTFWENDRRNDNQENCTGLDLVVNASPIGLKDESAPEWIVQLLAKLNDDCLCFDLVYRKNSTLPTFTSLALSRRLKAIDGLPMLIHQARYAFEFWTSINVPAEIMQKALRQQSAFQHKTFPAAQ